MKILVLHSDVPPDAPPEDQDTLIAARAISEALQGRGHSAPLAAFVADREALRKTIAPHPNEPDNATGWRPSSNPAWTCARCASNGIERTRTCTTGLMKSEH